MPVKFRNLSETPQLAKGLTILDILKAYRKKPKDIEPVAELPSVKTDLKNYYSKELSVIWFGHSSYLIHVDGINILVDPVLSGHASPFRFMIKAFKGADVFKPGDMPAIDYLILTHNHYDHLDIKALKKLAPTVKKWIVPLRVPLDLRSLKNDPTKITELNWWQMAELSDDITIVSTPARHFSGRGPIRNTSLWTSYVLKIRGYSLFIGGDSGYDFHFKEVGEKYGPFDIAMLECGQYNTMWPLIHSTPEEAVREALELKARLVLPVHWGKFALALHPWTEPIERFVKAARNEGVEFSTPRIGEPVVLGRTLPGTKWW